MEISPTTDREKLTRLNQKLHAMEANIKRHVASKLYADRHTAT